MTGNNPAEFSQARHLFPEEGHAYLGQKARCDPGKEHQRLESLPIKHMHVLPGQACLRKRKALLSALSLAIHAKEAHGHRFGFPASR